MNTGYGRDLDLNLLRVFCVVADQGSVTAAAAQLYLTQPAVSAALRRLTEAVGAPLFTRQGRGLVLTSRGSRLFASARPHLAALVAAALDPVSFDPRTSDRTLRVGAASAMDSWLVPPLLRQLAEQAPSMRLVVVPVEFRTVADAIVSRRVDAAVSVADELASSVRRQALFVGEFVCLYDSKHVRVKLDAKKGGMISERDYFAREHVIVSYQGDLRGVVEDALQKTRRVRCSVASFNSLGALIDGTALLGTVPAQVAVPICKERPNLRTARLPFSLPATAVELLWSAADDDDDAVTFLRETIVAVARQKRERA